jgi:hypothetical protein
MSVPFDLDLVAGSIARSRVVPPRAVVGVLSDAPLRFAISPPLDLLFDDLIGFDAPTEWSAVAVVADVGGDPTRRWAWMASRSGRHATATAAARDDADAEPIAPGAALVMADVVRRSVGLRTDPPALSVELLDELTWIDALVGHAASSPLDVRSALALRPIVLRRSTLDAWEQLHARAAAESSLRCRRLFTWMDTGMFSRWVFGLWPSADELVATLVDLVEPSVAAAVLARCPRMQAHLAGLGTVCA